MNEIAKLIIQSGLLSESQIAEFQRWGSVIDTTGLSEDAPQTSLEFVQRVERALQKEDMVLVRETDFEALHNYLKTQKRGILHLQSEESSSDIEVFYSVSRTGEYLIPWMGETMSDLLTNGDSYLKDSDGYHIFFHESRELFYGEVKAFVVCKTYISKNLLSE